MFVRSLLLFTSLIMCTQSMAVSCVMTFVKDNCWLNYDVKMQVIDSTYSKEVLTVVAPKGKPWVRKEFNCTPVQTFMYMATFSPEIWAGQAGRIYRAKRYWTLPDTLKADERAWEIKVCYSTDFSETPLPPSAIGKCQCDFSAIPAAALK